MMWRVQNQLKNGAQFCLVLYNAEPNETKGRGQR